MSDSKTLIYRNTKEKYLTAFVAGFLCVFISILPVMIVEGGYFIYYGDYNAQQIHFYNLANDAVRNGQLGWNWYTDLGSDFLTSYSFYLSGSPFFWLSTILPRSLVTFSMPVLLAVKHGLAALTAYAYIRRFVRSKNASLIGALLYAYSGFQIYNIFFNHFQDVTAFFPLMLIAMEENVNNGRKGVFAFTVAALSIINYFFFTGQVVFLIIYFLIRIPCPDFHISRKKTLELFAEAILGTMSGAVMLLPSALSILGNYRVSEHLYGQSMVLYSDKTRIARIIQTFFMPSDPPARPNLFTSDNAKWSSIGGYLPLFSMTGVLTFMRSKKKHWASRLSLICMICAFIPVLNSAFYAFNSSYYARWFYMPILIFAMMTAQTIDDEDADPVPAIKICAVMLAAFGIISLLPKKEDDETVFFDFPSNFPYFCLTLAIAVVSLIVAAALFRRKKDGRPFMKQAVCLTMAASVICTVSVIYYCASAPSAANKYIDAALEGKDDVAEHVSDDNFFRVDVSENYDNYPMSWGLPSIRAFHSVVSPSIMEFYDAMDIQRDVASRPDLSHYALRELLSVKYYYNAIEEENENDVEASLPGFRYIGSNDNFEIYENENYLPMGFAYDTYISEDEAAVKAGDVREMILLKALVLNDEQIEKYGDILDEISIEDSSGLVRSDYEKFSLEKKENTSSSFVYDSYGFESEITLDRPQLVFFSVPYSSGWTAQVNGKPADVEKVSYGFMAVRCDEGENTITFSYTTPGIRAGIVISLTGITGILVLIAVSAVLRKKRKKPGYANLTHCYDYISTERPDIPEEYCDSLVRKSKNAEIPGETADRDKKE